MIVWREKFIATGVHFVVTLLLAATAAALIFLVWYPGAFDVMIGGTELFLLIVGSDLALGPLMSLVVYDRHKSRRALLFDYFIVGVIQIGALVYGVSIMSEARPAFIAFSGDRFEIVLAGDIKPAELAAARDPQFAHLPWTGPKYVAVVIPAADYQDALFQALDGNEEPERPKFYVPFDTQLARLQKKAKPLSELELKKPESKALIDRALANVATPREKLKWLPVRHFRGFWTAIVEDATGKIVAWVDLDPY